MATPEKNTDAVYDASTLGTPKMLVLGLQHLFAMFGATVLVPAITGLNVSTTLLFAGLGTLLFGFCRALGNVYSGFDFLLNMNIPSVVYNMLPYIISLVVLAFTSKKSRAPKAEGIPYDKGSR